MQDDYKPIDLTLVCADGSQTVMPGMSGFGLTYCKALRKHVAPSICLTTKGQLRIGCFSGIAPEMCLCEMYQGLIRLAQTDVLPTAFPSVLQRNRSLGRRPSWWTMRWRHSTRKSTRGRCRGMTPARRSTW